MAFKKKIFKKKQIVFVIRLSCIHDLKPTLQSSFGKQEKKVIHSNKRIYIMYTLQNTDCITFHVFTLPIRPYGIFKTDKRIENDIQ